jgi:hypothetical protein
MDRLFHDVDIDVDEAQKREGGGKPGEIPT